MASALAIMFPVCIVGALVFAGIILYMDRDTDRSQDSEYHKDYASDIRHQADEITEDND